MNMACEVKSDPRLLAHVLSNLLVQNDGKKIFSHKQGTNLITNLLHSPCCPTLICTYWRSHRPRRPNMQVYMAMAAKHLQTSKSYTWYRGFNSKNKSRTSDHENRKQLTNRSREVEQVLGNPNCRTAEAGIHRIGGLGIFALNWVCHPLTVFNSWLHQTSRTSLGFLGSGPKGFWPEKRKRFLQKRTKLEQEVFCQHVKRLKNTLSKTRTIRKSTKPEVFTAQVGNPEEKANSLLQGKGRQCSNLRLEVSSPSPCSPCRGVLLRCRADQRSALRSSWRWCQVDCKLYSIFFDQKIWTKHITNGLSHHGWHILCGL